MWGMTKSKAYNSPRRSRRAELQSRRSERIIGRKKSQIGGSAIDADPGGSATASIAVVPFCDSLRLITSEVRVSPRPLFTSAASAFLYSWGFLLFVDHPVRSRWGLKCRATAGWARGFQEKGGGLQVRPEVGVCLSPPADAPAGCTKSLRPFWVVGLVRGWAP